MKPNNIRAMSNKQLAIVISEMLIDSIEKHNKLITRMKEIQNLQKKTSNTIQKQLNQLSAMKINLNDDELRKAMKSSLYTYQIQKEWVYYLLIGIIAMLIVLITGLAVYTWK